MSRKGQWRCEGSGAQNLWGVADQTEIVQYWEEEVQGDLITLYSDLKEGFGDVEISLFSQDER